MFHENARENRAIEGSVNTSQFPRNWFKASMSSNNTTEMKKKHDCSGAKKKQKAAY